MGHSAIVVGLRLKIEKEYATVSSSGTRSRPEEVETGRLGDKRSNQYSSMALFERLVSSAF